jgi:hypothetical protein
MTMKFDQDKRVLLVTATEEGFSYYLSPPPPFRSSEIVLLNKLLENNESFLKTKNSASLTSTILLVNFLEELATGSEKNVFLENLFLQRLPSLQQSLGNDWHPQSLRTNWKYANVQGYLDWADTEEIFEITKKEHVVIYNVVSWN